MYRNAPQTYRVMRAAVLTAAVVGWAAKATLLLAAPDTGPAGAAPASEVPLGSWDDLALYPARGLSPLYPLVGAECQRILVAGARWEVFPRPISSVLVSPDQPPCFEMHNGDYYYNELGGNAQAIRWAAEQSWGGAFRLLFNASALARRDDELWLSVDGFSPRLKLLRGKNWATYRPPDSASLGVHGKPNWLARDVPGAWWVATQEGLYRVQEGQWERAKIPGWPGGPAQGVVGDGKGRLVAWSGQTGGFGATVGFYADGQWSSVSVYRVGQWTAAGIRPDGGAVLAGPSQVVVVKPAARGDAAGDQLSGPKRQQELDHLRQGHFDLGDGLWVRPLGTFGVTGGGSALFAAIRLRDGPRGLVRLRTAGPPEWIDLAIGEGVQIAPSQDDGFLILARGAGVFALGKSSREPQLLDDSADLFRDDKLLGCDGAGRAYLQRGRAVLAFSPRGKPAPAIVPRKLADLPAAVVRPVDRRTVAAAVDARGGCWFVDRDGGRVMVLPQDKDEPHPYDDCLRGAQAFWPGRDGAMLMLLDDGTAALGFGGRRLEVAASLVDLGRLHFREMLAAAPRSSGDGRRDLRRQPGWRPAASPWLATGKCLWLEENGAICRLRMQDQREGGPGAVEVKRVCEGGFELLGPLRSGHLLLAKDGGSGRQESLDRWFWVEAPEDRAELKLVASPPAKVGTAILTSPATVYGAWRLDAQGALWLHQGFDRVYRIDSPGQWPLLSHFGEPEFEHPNGCVWAYHSARVFAGYEVARNGFRHSCRPTYLDHLTPLFAADGEVTCLTPDGLAVLRFDPKRPADDGVVRRFRVRWGNKPLWYLGHSESRAFFVTTGPRSESHLVLVDLRK